MNAHAKSDPYLVDADSPLVFDTETGDTPQSYQGFFFDASLTNDVPLYGENGYPASPFQSPMPPKTQAMQAKRRGPSRENILSTSSESQDSSSDSSGRLKRHTSSRSSHSFNPQRVSPGRAASRPNGMEYPTGRKRSEELDFKAMESAFDFNSAANTPSPLTSASSIATGPSARFVAIPQDSPRPASSMLQPQVPSAVNMQEHSPNQRMYANFQLPDQHTSHTSPASSDDFLDMTTLNTRIPSFGNGQQMQGMFAAPTAISRAPPAMALRSGGFPSVASSLRETPSTLKIHPTPQKSRVETQIQIKMSLFPMPPGVKRLHLPPHTISKPKLLTRPRPQKQRDMLELHTSLVCTSAMHDPAKLQRALDRAIDGKDATIKAEDRRRASADDAKAASDAEEDPLSGGDVQICAGCINRERKRAARKKSKKPEEEEPWQKDEAKRVIVFNTSEIKEWQEPSASNPTGDSDETSVEREASPIHLPEGTMQIDIPMRIACYCRHKSEKMGFQVIFTLKDWEGKLIAQNMTSPIMITDDHKTHGPPASSSGNGLLYDQIALPGGSMIAQEPLDNYMNGLHRNAHSTNDLQALQNQFIVPFGQRMVAPFAVPQAPSQTTSTTLTPRNLSRQASPSATGGCHKKRKGSGGAIRLPDNLQMTRLPGASSSASQNWPSSAGPSTSPNRGYPYTSTFPTASQLPVSQQSEQYFASPPSSNNDFELFGHSNRSQSFENLNQARGVYSLPSSTRPSRSGSPILNAQGMNGIMATRDGTSSMNATHSLFAANGTSSPSRNPVINKLIPSEGPTAGGIEVTCLGSGFSNGLEIMFGDCVATTTTFWGETSLVCLLPPASRAGSVAVTFRHQYMQMKAQRARFPSQALPRPHILFKYIDDNEQELLRQALILLNHKVHGTFGEVSDIARSIINGASGSGQGSMDGQPMGSQRSVGHFDAEAAVLKVLEAIDLDDSPYEPRLNMRRKNGQGILHLASSLGYARLVAGMLARGANPDIRDLNGLSPMHMAAINGHAGIVQRLRRARGDPWLRSLRGYTPADMSVSPQVLEAIQTLSHTRSQSQGLSFTDRSRASSFSSTISRRRLLPEESSYEYGYSDESDDEASEAPLRASRRATPSQAWARSRQNSMEPEIEIIEPALGISFPAAAMTAWRDSLAAQIQQFQQSVTWNFPNLPNLPNLQLPNLPSLPTIPENYQAGSMVRRFSSLVPQRSSSPPSASDGDTPEMKDGMMRVWDRLTGASSSPAPPAYEEIYPQEPADLDVKTTSAATAAADAAADIKCAAIFDGTISETATKAMASASSSTSEETKTLAELHDHDITEEEREAKEFRRKKLSSDRKLFFIWIPILIFVVLAVLKNQMPHAWHYIAEVSSRIGEAVGSVALVLEVG